MLPLRDDNPTRRTAWVTLLLIATCAFVYFRFQPAQTEVGANVEFNYEHAAIPCELTTGEPLALAEAAATVRGVGDELCELAPPGAPQAFPSKSVYLAVLVSMFLHGGLAHLVFNMLFLWTFGNNVEDHLGRWRYVVLYVAAGVVATISHVALQPDSTVPLVGASGAIAGAMGAYMVWFPRAPILTLVSIFPMHIQARWLLGFWFVSQFFINPNEGVAWAAHVGGFVFGVLAALVVRRSPAAREVVWRYDDSRW